MSARRGLRVALDLLVLVLVLVLVLCGGRADALRSWSLPRWAGGLTRLAASTSDFKNGMAFELDGVPVRLMEFLHVKPGKGAAFVRTKVKNLLTGSVQERTFRAGESIQPADVTKTEMQYTYTDGESICFMNMETFEEQRIDQALIPNVKLLKEGLSCQVSMWDGRVIDVALPLQAVYTIVETPPNYKGNTVTGGQKPAVLDSGAVVSVPVFLEVGQKITVSTEDCKYVGKAQ